MINYILYSCSFATIILIAVFLVIAWINNYCIKTTYARCVVLLLIISLSFISYCIIPNNLMDLSRNFDIFHYVKDHGMASFNTRIALENEQVAIDLTDYAYIIYVFFLSLSQNEHLLPFVSNIIIYLIFAYIIFDFNNNKNIAAGKLLFFLIMFFSFTNIGMNFSGLRYPVAAAILSLALYKDLYKNNFSLLTIFIYLAAFLFHKGIVPFVLLRIIIKFMKKAWKPLALLLIGWSCSGSLIGELLYKNSKGIFKDIGYKLLYYCTYQNRAWDLSLVLYLTISIILILSLYLNKTYKTKILNENVKSMIIVFITFILGALGSFQIFARYFYILAYIGTPFMWTLCSSNGKSREKLCAPGIMLLALGALACIQQIRILYYYEFVGVSWIWQ